jgi:peptidyl-prolyl cis-trans isomerase B (cyclophilin B)
MMLKIRTLLIAAAVLLSGCDHNKNVNQLSDDSEMTGIPAQPLSSHLKTPPRAALVALPSAVPFLPPPPVSTSSPVVESTSPLAANSDSAPPEANPAPIPASTDIPGSSAAAANSEAASSEAPTAATPSAPPGPPDPNQDKLVILDTSYGRIIIALDDFAAPKTCRNFRQLILDGFYNNTVFHRVIPNFIIQGGDPNSKSSATDRNTYGLGGPGYTIPAEINLKHDRGAVAMARLPDSVNPQRDSNGSQFYICLAPSPTLDDQYTVFGHVIQGMDVADKIAETPRDQRDNPVTRVQMTVSLETKEQALGNGSASNN